MKKLCVVLLLLSSSALAQAPTPTAPDPRLCTAEKQQAEADVASLVQEIYTLKAQLQIAQQDRLELEKKLAPPAIDTPSKPQVSVPGTK